MLKKEDNFTEKVIGTIVSASSIRVTDLHGSTVYLPIAEYMVDGVSYKIRVPSKIAVPMENQARIDGGYKGTLKGAKDILQGKDSNAKVIWKSPTYCIFTYSIGKKVVIAYNPKKPKEAKVISEAKEE